MNSEDPDFSPLQSDPSETLSDRDGPAQLAEPGATWLVLAYADWTWPVADATLFLAKALADAVARRVRDT